MEVLGLSYREGAAVMSTPEQRIDKPEHLSLSYLRLRFDKVKLGDQEKVSGRGSRLDLTQAATLAALLGITGILIHSFVDFNLQIPANAAVFYVLAAIAAASFQITSRRRGRSH